MNLSEILNPACVKVPLAATDKKAAIDELVDLLAAASKISDPAGLKTAVWARESTRTTGIGHALAIPHGKASGIPGLCMAVGKPAQPIDFNSIDGKPVRLIVLLASPIDKTNDHIQALAKVSRLMATEDFRNKIYAATTADQILELLQQQETVVIKK
ncbi:MAG: PTS sugar transporter subunit IIA [Phycisphaerae bacterium]|nr:PTS sugar transporter subunit IIA [Phycisphaerae bacterium]